MSEYKYGKVVHILGGSIEPTGESNSDRLRKENLYDRIDIMYRLIDDMVDVTAYKNRPEASMKTLAEESEKGLRDLVDYIQGHLD